MIATNNLRSQLSSKKKRSISTLTALKTSLRPTFARSTKRRSGLSTSTSASARKSAGRHWLGSTSSAVAVEESLLMMKWWNVTGAQQTTYKMSRVLASQMADRRVLAGRDWWSFSSSRNRGNKWWRLKRMSTKQIWIIVPCFLGLIIMRLLKRRKKAHRKKNWKEKVYRVSKAGVIWSRTSLID